ncbi:hypothetical protein BDV93DRAFT_611704 [Ceratobasidium sp. AG-I]|nr:hypothetical protein BDV93DRAFT_611704 [Ceratobasidium sp. AG-I]
MTTLEINLPPPIPLTYSIEGCSSYSSNYRPEHILVDRPNDISSRWTTEQHPNPSVRESPWIMLKLDQMSIIKSITFGKFNKPHPCNISHFRVFGGLGTKDQELHELLSAKLNDDHVPQSFSLNCKTASAGVSFPCRYIKICPIPTYANCYNMSIWYVALTGTSTPTLVQEVYDRYNAHKNNVALHLILKHLRRNNFLTAHSALLEQTNVKVEHPRVTKLHDALVLRGDLVEAEDLVQRLAREDGLFNYCASMSPPACAWKKIVPDGPVPPGRGGHQLCMDVATGTIYLFGGWDGHANFADFWSYSVANNQWALISGDTSTAGGPGARSCHNMVFSPNNGNIYVLGQLKESHRQGVNPQPQRSDSDFFKYSTRAPEGGGWTVLNPAGLEPHGGPPSLSDHQMVVDAEHNLMYVFGGRIEAGSERDGQQQYSGMYLFHLQDETWSQVFGDPPRQDGPQSSRVNISSRTGHGMVLYPPTGELFIVGGRRSNSKNLPDMHVFSPATRTSHRLGFDPSVANAASAPRVCIDEELGEIYVLIWQNTEREREHDRVRVPASDPATFATYHISKKRWVRSEVRFGPFKSGFVGGNVWESLELPRPRSAHQVVYDNVNKVFYMFGGNSGEDGTPRLNDLWSMRLVRPTVDELLRKALLAVRKFRFKKLCDSAPPFEALTYLQTQLAEVVNNDDEDEAAELRGLLSYLLNKTATDDFEMVENISDSTRAEELERNARRELFDYLMQFVAPDEREPETELKDMVDDI